MTKAQQYHERERDAWMQIAKYQRLIFGPRLAAAAVNAARTHNHKALHVRRLTRARQAQA